MRISSDNSRAIVSVLVAGFGFSVSDSLTKLSTLSLPLGEVLAIRGLASSILFFCALLTLGQVQTLAIAKDGKVIARSFFELCGTITYVLAITHSRIADSTAIVLSSPIFITLFAIAFYREKIGWHRWSAIICGMIGVVCVIRPDPSSFNRWALFATLAAVCSASRDIITRGIKPGASALAIALVATIVTTLFGLALSLDGDWVLPGAVQFAVLAGAGVVYAMGIYMNVLAFNRSVSLSLVSPFRYAMLIWTTIVAYFIFGELPDRYAIAGSILIIGSGLYVLHREMIRRRYVSTMISFPKISPGAELD